MKFVLRLSDKWIIFSMHSISGTLTPALSPVISLSSLLFILWTDRNSYVATGNAASTHRMVFMNKSKNTCQGVPEA